MPFPRSLSETSFLLIRPLPTSAPASTATSRLSSALLARNNLSFLLPLLALGDVLATLILGVLVAGKEEADLIAWGLVRATVVLWVGWSESGGRRARGGGGGEWIATTSTISLLLVLWQLNLLVQTRTNPLPTSRPAHGPTNTSTLQSIYHRLDQDWVLADGLDDLFTDQQTLTRHMKPHLIFLLTTTIFSTLEYSLYLTLSKLIPRPAYLGKRRAFAVRAPRQTAAHLRYSSERVSSSSGHLQLPEDPTSPLSPQGARTSSRFRSTSISHSSAHLNPNNSSRTNQLNGEETEEAHDWDERDHTDEDDEEQDESDGSDSDISDSEIIDIPPPSVWRSGTISRQHRANSTRSVVPLDLEESAMDYDVGLAGLGVGSLERGLARSWSRREIRRLRDEAGGEDGDEEEDGGHEGSYGTFEVDHDDQR